MRPLPPSLKPQHKKSYARGHDEEENAGTHLLLGDDVVVEPVGDVLGRDAEGGAVLHETHVVDIGHLGDRGGGGCKKELANNARPCGYHMCRKG